MSFWNSRLSLLVAIVYSTIVLAATAGAQCPIYSLKWELNNPVNVSYPIAVDEAGDVYVADWPAGRIEKFTSSGAHVGGWGSGEGEFSDIDGLSIATDGVGFVYVLDRWNKRVQKFTNTGTYVMQWQVHPDTSIIHGYTRPVSIAADRTGNCVYVADINTEHIQKFTGTGEFLTQWGSYGTGDGQFLSLIGIAVDATGSVYAVDPLNARVQVFASDGSYLTQWGIETWPHRYYAIAVDRTAGDVYVIDRTGSHGDYPRVRRFSGSGSFLCEWGSCGDDDGQFCWPGGVAVGPAGEVYVTDSRIQQFVAGPVPTNRATWGRMKATYR